MKKKHDYALSQGYIQFSALPKEKQAQLLRRRNKRKQHKLDKEAPQNQIGRKRLL